MNQTVTVTVPATTANLGPGFDCLGLSLALYNEITFTPHPDLKITVTGESAGKIPTDHTNLIAQSAHHLFQHAQYTPPHNFHIHQINRVPVSSGLGSSSTAIVGGLLAANTFLPTPYTKAQLLTLATQIEGHPDNVTPALYGGLQLIVDDHIQTLTTPLDQAIIVLPAFSLSTAQARAALPAQIPISHAIYNASHMGLLIHALQTGDYTLLRIAMQDKIHQPYRLPLIPGASEAAQAALNLDAAVALSGAGPSLIAFAPHHHTNIAHAMTQAFAHAGIPSRYWLLPLDQQGSHVHIQ